MEVSDEHSNPGEDMCSSQNNTWWCLSPDPGQSSDSELSFCLGNLHCCEGSTPRRRLQLTPELLTPSPTQKAMVSPEMTTPTDIGLPKGAECKHKREGSGSRRCSIAKMVQHSGKAKERSEDPQANKENRRLRVKLSSRFAVSTVMQDPARGGTGWGWSPRAEGAKDIRDTGEADLVQPLLLDHEAQYKHRLHPLDIPDSQERNLIGDYSKPHLFPVERGAHQDLQCISAQTVASLLRGNYKSAVESYLIIDCRYPYEYQGGHIKGAVNIHSEAQLQEALFQDSVPSQVRPQMKPPSLPVVDSLLDTRGLQERPSVSGSPSGGSSLHKPIIFHCEFSIERGPRLCRYLREMDRNLNVYPQLFYPELYVLAGGYKEFHSRFPGLCDPCGYIPMRHRDFKEQLRRFRGKRRSRVMRPRKRLLFKPDSFAISP